MRITPLFLLPLSFSRSLVFSLGSKAKPATRGLVHSSFFFHVVRLRARSKQASSPYFDRRRDTSRFSSLSKLITKSMERRRRHLYGLMWIGMESWEIFLFSILLQVAWLRVDTQTILTIASHVITKNHRIAVSHSDHRTWFLHIREVKESDRGWYMCQINTDPMKSQTGYLEVVGKRSFDLIEYLIFSNRN